MNRIRNMLILLCAAAVQHVCADMLYNVTFDNLTPGSAYTSASGPINDFSIYSQGQSSQSTIESAFFGLIQQPLVSFNGQASRQNTFGMQFYDATNHIVTLQMNLCLGNGYTNWASSGPNLGVTFSSPLQGESQTVVGVSFGWAGLVGSVEEPLQVSSFHGPIYLSQGDYGTSTTYTRETPYYLEVVINTLAHSFDVSVNNQLLADDAPYFGGQVLDSVAISVGDLGTTGSVGYGGIDNVRLQMEVIPEPSSLVLAIAGIITAMIHGVSGVGPRGRPVGVQGQPLNNNY